MALTYTGTNGLFTHLGKLIKHYNQFKTDATHATTGLDADRDDILDTFQAADQDVVIDGLVSSYERWETEYVGRCEELAQFSTARLQDEDSVLKEIGASSNDIDEVIAGLINEMDDDSESVLESSVSIGTVSAGSGNVGGGTVITTDILDGATSPGVINGVTLNAHKFYRGRTTEMCVNGEKFRFQVTADSFQDNLTEGAEEISWQGCVNDEQHGLGDGGSGFVGTIQPIHAVTTQYLTNPDFENFTSNAPDDWDIVSGSATINIAESTSDVDHGSKSLSFLGDGSTSSIEIKQDLDPTTLVANKLYCITAKLQREDSGTTTGTLSIKFEGTGYTEGSSEKINVGVSTLGTSFALHHCFVVMPSVIPSDFKMIIRWDGGTPGAAEQIYIDDLGLGPVNYGGGFGVIAVRDSGPFARGDSYELTVTNTEGVFQGFFRRAFGAQLPSVSSSPTIADTLAQ